jgi:Right handed beta helix region
VKTPLFFCILFLTLSPEPAPAADRAFFVSTTGNDSDPGTLEKPFRTVTRAQEAVHRIRMQRLALNEPVTVFLRGGRYELDEPIVFGPDDGGTSTSPTVYAAYEHEVPVLSGGLNVAGWKTEGNLLSAPLPDIPLPIHQVWVNGVRRAQSRIPTHGYYHVSGIPDITDSTQWMTGQWRFQWDAAQPPPGDAGEGSEVVVMNKWVEARLPLVRVNRDSMVLGFSRRSIFRLEPDDPYYYVNVRSGLDSAGQWFLDKAGRRLLYHPLSSEKTNFETIVPHLPQVVLIKGKPEEGRFVRYLHFRGVTFSHTEWILTDRDSVYGHPRGTGGFVQAAVGLPAAVEAIGMRNASFAGCTFSRMGTYGLALRAGCMHDTVRECTFSDLGGGGIKIGETEVPRDSAMLAGDNIVADCEIGDGGLLFHSAIGIWIGQSPGNRIIHNRIHDFYYSGISIGWTWGYGPAMAGGNIVELNQVHHIGVRTGGDGPILSDMGGIYTLGTQHGTVIRQNIFHDIAARVYGGWGIYFDEGSTDIVAEQNLVYRTTHGGFHQHYGKDNIFRNNILAFGRDDQAMRTREESHTSFAFEHNIVYWASGPMFIQRFPGWSMIFDRNIYWCTNGREQMTDSLDFKGWRALGFDEHSRFQDPLFLDVAGDDFRLKPSSPALAMGFRPIPYDTILDSTPIPPDRYSIVFSPPRHRFLYNNDGSNILMAFDTLTPGRAYTRIDPLAGTGVTTFLHNVNPGQNPGYPSSIDSMYHWTPPTGTAQKGWGVYGKRMSDNLARLVGEGVDPIAMVVDRARLRGMEVLLTYRMNELHDVDKPESPLLSRFWRDHPEFRVGGYAGWGASALNYAIPEVREHVFSLLREVCERYDAAGLELDFMRFPYYFPYDKDSMQAFTHIMTAFVRRVRTMLDTIGTRRGKRLLLAVRVPTSLTGCAYLGLDPATWAREHLIDFLTVAPFLSTETDIPVSEFHAACGPLPVYTGMEFTIGSRMMTREEKRAAATLLYDAGSDGIYLFNYFVAWDAGLQADMDVLPELSNPDSLIMQDKLYTLAIPRYPVANVSLPSPMPLSLLRGESRSVTMKTNEPVKPERVVLRIECAENVTPADLEISFNGQQPGDGTQSRSPMIFPQPVEYSPASTPKLVEYTIDPDHLKKVNLIELRTTGRTLHVDWIYLAVWHAAKGR